MSSFHYEGKQIYYEEIGNGKPLLLLHGNTACGKMFAPILPMLSEKHHVIVPDFLGCGQSERCEKWSSDLWYEWSRQATALCKYKGFEKVDVIGSSGGAIAAINMALENPDMVNTLVADSFEGLSANSDITEQIRIGREYAKQNEDFRRMLKLMHGDDWESVVDADTEAIIAHAKNIGAFFHKPIDELKVSLLLTGSAKDEMFPAGHYHKLFESICSRTCMAKSHIFEQGGHPAMMSNMKEFISLCEEFFA
jgi:pimeloyl-ACP methyl ester carboxylesterase